MDRKIIIIPTYNEKENIEKIIRAVFDRKASTISLLLRTAPLTEQLKSCEDFRMNSTEDSS